MPVAHDQLRRVMAKEMTLFCPCSLACRACPPAPPARRRRCRRTRAGHPHTAKRGGSGVKVAYRIEGAAQPNVPARITVELSSVTAQEGATAAFSAEEPARLNGAAALSLRPNQTNSASLELTAPSDGMYFINVTTTQAGRSSIVQIPIKVGAGAARLERQGTVQTTPSGEQVLVAAAK